MSISKPGGALLVFALLTAALWFGSLDNNVGFYMDDHLYYVPAKALAEGRGYRLISRP